MKLSKVDIENPCRSCGNDPMQCNKSCQELDNFLGPIGGDSFGVADTTDEIGYRILVG